ncbi:MAG: DUF402 domain-containing protein [Bacilli bacterium]|nr:DUF402 domain-containing protein [Bacilli bacterium]
MNNLKGKWIEIQGYKHDGRMHRIWDSVYVLDETEEYIVVCSTKTKVVEHDFRIRYTKEPAIMVFFKNSWWNVIAMLKKTGITYYVNLASPFIVDSQKIKYIDYDLDLKMYPNGDIKVIDVREYGFHRKKYGYSEDIDTILRYNLVAVKKEMQDKNFPFDKDKIVAYYEQFVKEVKND